MSDGGYEPRRRSGIRRDTIGLALIGLVIVLSLLIAAAIALPAWTSINAVPTATPTPEAVGMVGSGAGLVAAVTLTPKVDVSRRPVPPLAPDDGPDDGSVVRSGPPYPQESALPLDVSVGHGGDVLDQRDEWNPAAALGMTGE